MLKRAEVTARAVGVRLQIVEARGLADFDRAFSDMAKAHTRALTVLSSTVFFSERKRLVDLAAKNRLPAVYPWREGVDAGGLMSYGSNVADLFRRAATRFSRVQSPATCPSSSRRRCRSGFGSSSSSGKRRWSSGRLGERWRLTCRPPSSRATSSSGMSPSGARSRARASAAVPPRV
jgi:hypothetical protein